MRHAATNPKRVKVKFDKPPFLALPKMFTLSDLLLYHYLLLLLFWFWFFLFFSSRFSLLFNCSSWIFYFIFFFLLIRKNKITMTFNMPSDPTTNPAIINHRWFGGIFGSMLIICKIKLISIFFWITNNSWNKEFLNSIIRCHRIKIGQISYLKKH